MSTNFFPLGMQSYGNTQTAPFTNEGTITTIIFPSNSGLLATCEAAQSAAPEEIPARIPSSAPARLAYLIASSFGASSTSS